MNMIWFLRMAKWARKPPSAKTVLIWAAVVALCGGIALVEVFFGWPEALTVNKGGIPRPKLTSP